MLNSRFLSVRDYSHLGELMSHRMAYNGIYDF